MKKSLYDKTIEKETYIKAYKIFESKINSITYELQLIKGKNDIKIKIKNNIKVYFIKLELKELQTKLSSLNLNGKDINTIYDSIVKIIKQNIFKIDVNDENIILKLYENELKLLPKHKNENINEKIESQEKIINEYEKRIKDLENKLNKQDKLINILEKESKNYDTKINNIEKKMAGVTGRKDSINKDENIFDNFLISNNDKLLFENSNIIKKQSDIDFLLKEFNNRKLNISKLKLIYSALNHGSLPVTFHNLCDNKSPTITLILTTKNLRFGGYTEKKWDNCCGYKSDENAFCFSINRKKIYPIKKREQAIYCKDNYGPCFFSKGSFIIYLFKDFFKVEQNTTTVNESSYSNMMEDYELNNGEWKFFVKELEVFQVILNK